MDTISDDDTTSARLPGLVNSFLTGKQASCERPAAPSPHTFSKNMEKQELASNFVAGHLNLGRPSICFKKPGQDKAGKIRDI